jgi:hypothetical protein
MSTTVTNKTQKPLSLPLPRGKLLHLGPGKSGQIASNAALHPPLKALVDSGAIEILEEGQGHTPGADGGPKGRPSTPGYTSGSGTRRSGDR